MTPESPYTILIETLTRFDPMLLQLAILATAFAIPTAIAIWFNA